MAEELISTSKLAARNRANLLLKAQEKQELSEEEKKAVRAGAARAWYADLPGAAADITGMALDNGAEGLSRLLPSELAGYDLPKSLGIKRFQKAMRDPALGHKHLEKLGVDAGYIPPTTGTEEEERARLLAGFIDPVPLPVGSMKFTSPVMNETSKASKVAPKSYVPVAPEQANHFIDDFPTIDPQDLVGKKVFPIVSDLTDGGTVYTGIDSSRLDVPEQLFGGPKFPGLASSRAAGSVWALQGKGKATAKLTKDADYAVVVSMLPESHKSNTSFVNSALKTMQSYVRDGRITGRNLKKINKLIRTPTKNKAEKALKTFPGFDSPNFTEYLQGLNFESRARIAQVLDSTAAQEAGAPNITKMLRKTQDPSTYGLNRNDAILVIEIDKTGADNLVELGKAPGTLAHPSYKYGIKGRVVGKFATPVNYETIWSKFVGDKRAAGKTDRGIVRAFDLSLPVTEITQEIADKLPTTPLQAIQSPRQANLVIDTVQGNWKTSDELAKKGGIAPVDFVAALKASDASATLTPYSLKEVQDGIRSGDFKIYQLGDDGQIFFGLKKNYNFFDEYGFEHPDLTPNEVALVGVVNNEPGAKGVAGPSVLLKAIEEGATALDAFAVPSKKYPGGFLPKLYNEYGFEEVGRLPFEEQYYTAQQLKDLKEYWRSTGWDESLGMPEVSIMKFRGDDAIRSNATSRFFNDGEISPRRQTPGAATTAIEGTGQRTGPDTGRPSGPSGTGDLGRDPRSIRTDSGPRLSGRIRSVLDELENLSPSQAKNLGLNPEAINSLRSARVQRAAEGMMEKALP